MKKLFLIFFLVILFSAAYGTKVYSQSLTLEASVQAGILNLNTKEKLLYENGSTLSTLSLLDWKTTIIPCIALDTQLCIADTFYIKAGGQFTLPFSAGTMKDYDWQNIVSTGGTELTRYSEHKNSLNRLYDAELCFGVGGSITPSVRLVQFFSVKYSYQSVTAKNGWRQYGQKLDENNEIYAPWSKDIEKKTMNGKSVTFETQDIFLGLGTQLIFSFNDAFSMKLFINILPSLNSKALDTHYKRDLYTYFDFCSKLEFDAKILLEYKINKANFVTVQTGFSAAAAENGVVFQNSQKLDKYPGAVTAMSWSFLLGYTYRCEK